MNLKKYVYITLSFICVCACIFLCFIFYVFYSFNHQGKAILEPFYHVDNVIFQGYMTDCKVHPPQSLQKEVIKELNILREKTWDPLYPFGKSPRGLPSLTVHHNLNNKKIETTLLFTNYAILELSTNRGLGSISGFISPKYNQKNAPNTIKFMEMYNAQCTSSVR